MCPTEKLFTNLLESKCSLWGQGERKEIPYTPSCSFKCLTDVSERARSERRKSSTTNMSLHLQMANRVPSRYFGRQHQSLSAGICNISGGTRLRKTVESLPFEISRERGSVQEVLWRTNVRLPLRCPAYSLLCVYVESRLWIQKGLVPTKWTQDRSLTNLNNLLVSSHHSYFY